MSGGDDNPAPDIRDQISAAVQLVLARGLKDTALEEALVDATTTVATDAVTANWLEMMGRHLASLPELERKAKMFDILVRIGALEPEGLDALRSR